MTSGSGAGEGGARGPLARGHPVPLGRQLAAGLEAAIRDGHVRSGSRLPSTRDLARRLGLHRSTVGAAYARLRRRGCVEGRERGRLSVAPTGPFAGEGSGPACPAALAVDCMAVALRRAASDGVSRRDLLAAFARTLAELDDAAGAGTVGSIRVEPCGPLLVEPRPGLRCALAAELEWRLGVPVTAARVPPNGPYRGPLLARPKLLSRLDQARVGGRPARRIVELIPLPLAGGTRERGLVRRSVRGGVVALVSVSASVRGYARELAAREFARGVSFTAVDPRDTAAVVRVVAVARLVLFDEASREAVPRTAARSVAIRLVRPGPIAAIRGYLGVGQDPRDPRRGT